MEPSPHITKALKELEGLLHGTAKNLLNEVYGPDGPAWGTRFTELEDVAVALGDTMARQFLNQALAQQSGVSPGPAHLKCSQCGQRVVPGETQARIVQTRVGDAEWLEPEGYCDQCRKAFFPSVQEPGD